MNKSIEECGIKEELRREYGFALKGIKVEDTKRGKRFHRINVAAAVTHLETGIKNFAHICYKSSIKTVVFEELGKGNLLKEVSPGAARIIYNAPFHRKKT